MIKNILQDTTKFNNYIRLKPNNNPKGPQIKVKQGNKEFYVDYDYLK
jgi:hypothetical protein